MDKAKLQVEDFKAIVVHRALVAYAQRGYWALGGEIFLIGLAAGLGAWMGGGET